MHLPGGAWMVRTGGTVVSASIARTFRRSPPSVLGSPMASNRFPGAGWSRGSGNVFAHRVHRVPRSYPVVRLECPSPPRTRLST